MGMFSYDCRGCGHPLLSSCSTDKGINEWMTEGIALFDGGDRVSGDYDGYGRLNGYEFHDGLDNAACWHRACWELAGEPKFDEASRGSADQGHFFDDGAHDVLDPRRTQFMAPEVIEEELKAAQAVRAAKRLDYNQRRAIQKAFDDAGWACWNGDDRERSEEREAALGQLRRDFDVFVMEQPSSWDVAEDATDLYYLWFDAMKAQAQIEWLAARAFEVKHFIPGKTEAV